MRTVSPFRGLGSFQVFICNPTKGFVSVLEVNIYEMKEWNLFLMLYVWLRWKRKSEPRGCGILQSFD